MSIADITNNLVVYKMLKLLSSPYDKWSYYDKGIIDQDGNIIKSKEATTFLKYVINLKKLILFHPMGKLKLSSFPIALTLLKESVKEIEFNEELLIEKLKEEGYLYDD